MCSIPSIGTTAACVLSSVFSLFCSCPLNSAYNCKILAGYTLYRYGRRNFYSRIKFSPDRLCVCVTLCSNLCRTRRLFTVVDQYTVWKTKSSQTTHCKVHKSKEYFFIAPTPVSYTHLTLPTTPYV